MMGSIRVRLLTHDHFNAHEPVMVICEFVNLSERPLWFLKWFTPFEALSSTCFHVRRNKADVEYDGPLVRRGRPSPRDYVFIGADRSVTASVNLRAAYDLSEQGTYSVLLRSRVIIRDQIPSADPVDFVRDGIELESAQVHFSVDGAAGLQTAGAMARAESTLALMKRSTAIVAGFPAPPIFNGGDAGQHAAAIAAHQNGFALCGDALNRLADDAHYVEFFGLFEPSRLAAVKAVFAKIDARMQNTQFTYDLTGSGCDPSWVAFTHKGSDKITMCRLFWQASPTGVESQAGAIVHEHSHSDASTDDIPPSGIDGARFLARTKPEDAIHNADNYESYSET